AVERDRAAAIVSLDEAAPERLAGRKAAAGCGADGDDRRHHGATAGLVPEPEHVPELVGCQRRRDDAAQAAREGDLAAGLVADDGQPLLADDPDANDDIGG